MMTFSGQLIWISTKLHALIALVDALETQLTTARTAAALVTELTDTPTSGKVSAPAASGTGRRGRPRKS